MSETPHPLEERLFEPGPKRILALDGGGIKGFLTLQFLSKIEGLLRERTGDPRYTLSDYFDLIGGTSTGSIIAGLLARGKSTDEILTIYTSLAEPVFKKRRFLGQVLQAKFPVAPLDAALEAHFGEMTLGSSEWETGFAAVAKNLGTGSPWVLYNNPRAKYFAPSPGSDSIANKDYLVRRIIRASTAAPTYFKPERIEIAPGVEELFADGGVTPHNNPAFLLFMLATLEGYRLEWSTGEHDLLICSVGTGNTVTKVRKSLFGGLVYGIQTLTSLMEDTSNLNEQMLQWMSTSPTAREIDSEVGDLSGDLCGGESKFTYLRYNVDLDAKWIEENLGIPMTEKEAKSLQQMDRPENKEMLAEVGRRAADRNVEEAHFPKVFDRVP